jgi:Ca2+-binding RTX toxin-like protein
LKQAVAVISVLVVLGVSAPAEAVGEARCFAEHVTILGTVSVDSPSTGFIGTTGNDVMSALYGDDAVRGGPRPGGTWGADDRICAGRGSDLARAGAGDDMIKGVSGKDKLAGGLRNDYILDGGGTEALGGSGNDHIEVGLFAPDPTRSLVRGGFGDDSIDTTDGNPGDTIHGGPGHDECVYNPGDIVHGCEELAQE